MPLTITDEQLQQMKMTEHEARIEIACRLFDADVLLKTAASRLAGLSRIDFEEELCKRGLAVIRIDEKWWEQELESLRKLEELRSARS